MLKVILAFFIYKSIPTTSSFADHFHSKTVIKRNLYGRDLLFLEKQKNNSQYSTRSRCQPFSHGSIWTIRSVKSSDLNSEPAIISTPLNIETIASSKSLSNVEYSSVLQNLDELYPPEGIQIRNAASRTDGYWSFVKDGKEPPKGLTYGEFDFNFFAYLIDRAHFHYYSSTSIHQQKQQPFVPVRKGYEKGKKRSQLTQTTTTTDWRNKVFLDIGSGAGRLVLGAASLHPNWSLCKGIEVLPGLHKLGVENTKKCHKNSSEIQDDGNDELKFTTAPNFDTYFLKSSISTDLPLAPVHLSCASILDPNVFIADTDCAFVFSSCMSGKLLEGIGEAIGRQCKPGTIVITTDYMLPLEGHIAPCSDNQIGGSYMFRLLEKIDGPCTAVGGVTSGYIHRVVKSLY